MSSFFMVLFSFYPVTFPRPWVFFRPEKKHTCTIEDQGTMPRFCEKKMSEISNRHIVVGTTGTPGIQYFCVVKNKSIFRVLHSIKLAQKALVNRPKTHPQRKFYFPTIYFHGRIQEGYLLRLSLKVKSEICGT